MEYPDQKELKRSKICPQESHQAGNGMENLPRDIACDVLSRLPTRSLTQFKFVCQAWHSISRDPRLPDMHLALANKNNPCLILQRNYPIRNQLYFVDHDPHQGYSKTVTEIDTPFKSAMPEFDIVGSCNGLLCLSDSLYCNPVFISNPFTGTHIELPKATRYRNQEVVFGFGFHPTTKEYKVLRIVHYKHRGSGLFNRVEYLMSEVEIFTLGTDTWRNIGYTPYRVKGRSTGSLVNGALHWVTLAPKGRRNRTRIIVSFDLAEEKFQEVPRPDCGILHFLNYHLVVIRGCLSAAVYCMNAQIEIWVMKEYSVKESWSKEFTIGTYVSSGLILDVDQPYRIWKNVSKGRLFRVLCLLKNGEILLEYKSKGLVSYNPESEEFKDLTIQGLPDWFETVIHVGSLISVEVAIGMQ